MLTDGPASGRTEEWVRHARELREAPVERVLAWVGAAGADVPVPGAGETLARGDLLAGVAAESLTVARIAEPHLDALAILAEAGQTPPAGATWGVWAAEGPGDRLEAAGARAGGGWTLTGRKPWCSLAGSVSHALVTAWVGPAERRLFRVELAAPDVHVEEPAWVPTGLRRVVTTAVRFDHARAVPVGAEGWYLQRPGFWWGGTGVAAIWYGGAVGLARTLERRTRERDPDQIGLLHVGEVDAALHVARTVLLEAARAIDAGAATGRGGALLAARVRHVVAGVAEDVLERVGHALGPGPLSADADHAARVADLGLYVRQHHAERDAAALGRLVLEGDVAW
ncbi:acyl-CoA dehydrogenase [Nocardioides anomalus]|uniref:Acyl-CoA dehydrogenase n=1 Tax=Nocardioides anomalus TaxID=2712223 RepID=A0A6G6WL46_9ACTN|nr:acyl-CoA dehydrogenase [Nocardioides anomalus]